MVSGDDEGAGGDMNEQRVDLDILNAIDSLHSRHQPDPDSRTIRVSELTKPFPMFLLGRRFQRRRSEDYGFPLHLGTAWDRMVREIIREMVEGDEFDSIAGRPAHWFPWNGAGWLQGKRFKMERGPWTLSGEPDLIYRSERGTDVFDHKLTSTGSFGKDPDSYQIQLSAYVALLSANGYPGPFRAYLLKFGKDSKAYTDKGPSVQEEVPLLSTDEIMRRLDEYVWRLEYYENEPLEPDFGCAMDERAKYTPKKYAGSGVDIKGRRYLKTAGRCEWYCGYKHVCPLYQGGGKLTAEGIE